MDILQLRYFYESAMAESFTKVAERHGVPASSVSASVKRLEQELGCKLFDRNNNRLTLNTKGKRLQSSLCVVFDELDSAVAALSGESRPKTHFRILVRSIRSMVTNAVIHYRKTHHNMEFHIDLDLENTDLGSYDLIIDEQGNDYSGFESFELCSLPVRFLASVDNPFCSKTVTLSQLRNQDFISFGPQSNLHKLLVRVCKNAGFTPNITVTTNDSGCYGRFIRENICIGLSRSAVKDSDRTGYIHVSDFGQRQTFLCYYRAQQLTPELQDFIIFLKSCDAFSPTASVDQPRTL